MSRVNPRVDFAFKKIFGSEENKDILLLFINAILPEQDTLASLELKNPYNLKDFASDKMTILDIRAIDNLGRSVTIEMQVTDQLYYEKRALFCWSEVYGKQLGEGQGYSDLKKTIAIHVLNFNLMDEEGYHNIYKIKNIASEKVAFEDFQLHTIELKKFDKEIPLSNLKKSLDRWMTFLTKAQEFSKNQIPEELKAEPGLEKAIKVLDTLYLDEVERTVYEGRLKWLRDEDAAIEKAKERGRIEGIAKGKAQGMSEGLAKGKAQGKAEGKAEGEHEKAINVAKKLKSKGMDRSEISAITGLGEEEIRKL